MASESTENNSASSEWILLPLSMEEFDCIYAWIKCTSHGSKEDVEVENKCESVLEKKFDKHGLRYSNQGESKVVMKTIRLWLGSDGVAIPARFFGDVPSSLERISNLP